MSEKHNILSLISRYCAYSYFQNKWSCNQWDCDILTMYVIKIDWLRFWDSYLSFPITKNKKKNNNLTFTLNTTNYCTSNTWMLMDKYQRMEGRFPGLLAAMSCSAREHQPWKGLHRFHFVIHCLDDKIKYLQNWVVLRWPQ